MTILVLDFMNAAHRARSGFLAGDYPVVFNFFRGLRSLVNQFRPTRVYVVLEGKPERRHQLLTEYKANRAIDQSDPRAAEMKKFFTQVELIKTLLKENFPVSVVRHPKHEADDTIANLIRSSSTAADWVIVSTDTDFIQLLERHANVKLYNPVKKQFVEPPDYPYVVWKALRGDPSDNIPGLPGCGDKTAARLSSDVEGEEFAAFISRDDNAVLFERNMELIQFSEWSKEEAIDMTSSSPKRDWDSVKSSFEKFGFASLLKEESWSKFVDTFETLWG